MSPKWTARSGSVLHLIATSGLRQSLESDTLHHGLFTYYLLRGLRGEADVNRNGEVTIGEVTAYINRNVPAAARARSSRTNSRKPCRDRKLPGESSISYSQNHLSSL